MTSPPHPLRVHIVGAGLGGLACAIALRRSSPDIAVTVLERAPRILPVGAGIQIPQNAARVWAQYGLLEELKKRANVCQNVTYSRWENGDALFAQVQGGESVLNTGMPWLLIHRVDYHRVLLEEAKRLGVKVELRAWVVDVDFEKTSVTLNGREADPIETDIIVGADGLYSTLREKLLGMPSPAQETGDLAYRGTFTRSDLLSLDDPAVDELLQRDYVTVWLGRKSHAVFYPIRGSQEYNLVLACPDNLPPNVRKKEGDLEEMRELFRGWDPLITKVIDRVKTVLKWKLCHHEELETWTRGNVVLLGDACHPSLPYQAQGAAMAVEDGAVLGTLLGLYTNSARSNDQSTTPPLKTVLELFEKVQKERTTMNVRGSASNQKLYHVGDGPEQVERDKILKAATLEEKQEDEEFLVIDVRYQKKLLGRDCIAEAEAAWAELIATGARD
ncbi:putative salicylate hydroxylase [Polyplosphaeria fusca]|uniref:Salicylate hydroxylase n=1 Tax=Polyplosphaeria fusca TaxID=682080 RepID=A0A9P4QUC2_9PLEO|nr:putative salicylate hydroxylase [Polyplosphaeria fusca]